MFIEYNYQLNLLCGLLLIPLCFGYAKLGYSVAPTKVEIDNVPKRTFDGGKINVLLRTGPNVYSRKLVSTCALLVSCTGFELRQQASVFNPLGRQRILEDERERGEATQSPGLRTFSCLLSKLVTSKNLRPGLCGIIFYSLGGWQMRADDAVEVPSCHRTADKPFNRSHRR